MAGAYVLGVIFAAFMIAVVLPAVRQRAASERLRKAQLASDQRRRARAEAWTWPTRDYGRKVNGG